MIEKSQEIRSLHFHCLHYSNEDPFQFEDRWINLKSIPEAEQEKFEKINPNKWLVQHEPWTIAEHILSATNGHFLKQTEVNLVTYVRLYYPGRFYQMQTIL